MAQRSRRTELARVLAVLTGVTLLAACDTDSGGTLAKLDPWACTRPNQEHMLVAELVFSTDQPNGLFVTDIDWQQFVADTVTPRFAQGIVTLAGIGQYWNKSANAPVRGGVKLLQIAAARNRETEDKLDQIVAAYKARFRQESMLLAERVECVAL